jgi:hypothetical protein
VKKTALLLLAGPAALAGSASPASASCTFVQAPSVWTAGGYGTGGPHVDLCGYGPCDTVASTPALSVPGVVAVGPASVNNCL